MFNEMTLEQHAEYTNQKIKEYNAMPRPTLNYDYSEPGQTIEVMEPPRPTMEVIESTNLVALKVRQ
jgi:hypothetical protein